MNATPEVIAERKTRFRELRRQGFNLTTFDRSTGHFRIGCDGCAAVVINQTPCHEHGCWRSRRAKHV